MTKVYADSVVVDENDNVIGQCQMPKAYVEGKILRVSVVMVVNSSGEVLIQQRGPGVLAPLMWGSSASGHVDVGESYEQAALRELQEEVGITASEDELTEYSYWLDEGKDKSGNGYRRFMKEFLVRSDEEPKIDGNEVVDFKWIKPSDVEASGLDCTPGLLHSAREVTEYLVSDIRPI